MAVGSFLSPPLAPFWLTVPGSGLIPEGPTPNHCLAMSSALNQIGKESFKVVTCTVYLLIGRNVRVKGGVWAFKNHHKALVLRRVFGKGLVTPVSTLGCKQSCLRWLSATGVRDRVSVRRDGAAQCLSLSTDGYFDPGGFLVQGSGELSCVTISGLSKTLNRGTLTKSTPRSDPVFPGGSKSPLAGNHWP